MLVLSRKPDETIHILVPGGPDILITVVDVRGDKVRLGVTAPREVTVHRAEVLTRIQQEGPRHDPQPAQADPRGT